MHSRLAKHERYQLHNLNVPIACDSSTTRSMIADNPEHSLAHALHGKFCAKRLNVAHDLREAFGRETIL
jgi:hypothetical protein